MVEEYMTSYGTVHPLALPSCRIRYSQYSVRTSAVILLVSTCYPSVVFDSGQVVHHRCDARLQVDNWLTTGTAKRLAKAWCLCCDIAFKYSGDACRSRR